MRDEAKQKACRIIGVALAALPLAACLAVLFAPRPAPANLWTPSAVGGNGVSAVALSAPSYTATAASGANAIIINNGAKVCFGGAGLRCLADVASSGPGTADSLFATNFYPFTTTNNNLFGRVADGAAAIGNKSGNTAALSNAGAKIHAFFSDAGVTEKAAFMATGALLQTGVAQAALGTPANGTFIYCTDCTIANPCAGGGTGALAKRLNGAWVCN